jgi:hypothetical protein
MLLTYFLNDFEMVPVAPIINGITFVFTFHMSCIFIVRSLYFRIFSAFFNHISVSRIIIIIIITIIIIKHATEHAVHSGLALWNIPYFPLAFAISASSGCVFYLSFGNYLLNYLEHRGDSRVN